MQIVGKVAEIKKGDLMSQVKVKVDGPLELLENDRLHRGFSSLLQLP